jgi:hypothetical protein
MALSLAALVAAVPIGVKVAAGNGETISSHGIAKQRGLSPAAVKLHDEMRQLWSEHVNWTGSYIVSALADLEDQQAVLARLLRNQQDIGNAIKPYYGDVAGNQLTKLLTEHIQIAGKIIAAVKSGNQAEANELNQMWYKNAAEISLFLSKLNPNWKFEEIKKIFDMHLQFIAEEVSARLKKDWAGWVAISDKNLQHMIQFADIISAGIIKQFPKKFR